MFARYLVPCEWDAFFGQKVNDTDVELKPRLNTTLTLTFKWTFYTLFAKKDEYLDTNIDTNFYVAFNRNFYTAQTNSFWSKQEQMGHASWPR